MKLDQYIIHFLITNSNEDASEPHAFDRIIIFIKCVGLTLILYSADDFSAFKDSRVMVVDRGKKSIETALDLTKYTGRVVVITPSKKISSTYADVVKEIKKSDIKIIYESELLEIRGSDGVEKVLVHDLNEDEEYELFVDAVIIL